MLEGSWADRSRVLCTLKKVLPSYDYGSLLLATSLIEYPRTSTWGVIRSGSREVPMAEAT